MAIRVIDTIKPKNDADFAIVEDINLKGGLSVVANATARDAITTNHRKAGMIVVTQDDAKVWQLDAGLTTWTERDPANTDDSKLIGGLRVVANNTARDAIVSGLRKQGMIVVTQDTGKLWMLDAGLTTWTEFVGGGGGVSPTFYTVTGTNPGTPVDFPVPSVAWAVVSCNSSAGPVTVQLTPQTDGYLVDVKDVSGGAAGFPVSITASEFIDGEELVQIINAHGGVRLMFRSGTWHILASHKQDTENPLVLNGLSTNITIPDGYPWIAISTNTTGGPITITIPSGSDGDVIEVKDGSGTAASNAITIFCDTADIDEHTDNTIEITDDHGGVRLMKIGIKWRIMPRFAAGGGTLAGDVTGPAGSNTVSALQGVPLNNPNTGVNGDVVTLNAVQWVTEDGMGAIGWDGSHLWATNWEPRLFKIDTATRTIVSQHDLSTYAINRAAEYVKTTSTRVILITPSTSRKVSIIRSSDGAEVGVIDPAVGGAGNITSALVIGSDDLYLCITDFFASTNTIYRFSLATIEAAYPTQLTIAGAADSQLLTAGDQVVGLAYNGSHIYASRRNAMWRLNAATLAEVDSFTFGGGETCNDCISAFGSIWTPADSGFVYRFDPATFPAGGSRTAIASTHTAATWIAADSTHIWVPDWDTNASVYRFSTGLGTEAQTQTITSETGDEHGYIAATNSEIWTAIDFSSAPGTGWMALRRFTTGATATYAGQFANYSYFGYGPAVPVLNLADITNPGGVLGDLARWNGTEWVRLPVGSGNQFLGVDGTPTPTWKTVEVGALGNTGGATGDLAYWNGSAWTRLPVGASKNVLQVSGGIPAWGAVDAVGDSGAALRAHSQTRGAQGSSRNLTPGGTFAANYETLTTTPFTPDAPTNYVDSGFDPVLINNEIILGGTVGGVDGQMYRYDIYTKVWTADGQLTGTSTYTGTLGAAVTQSNPIRMLAYQDWKKGNYVAVQTQHGAYVKRVGVSTPEVVIGPTTSGWQNGHIAIWWDNNVRGGFASTAGGGWILFSNQLESALYAVNTQLNTYQRTAVSGMQGPMCVDGDGYLWIAHNDSTIKRYSLSSGVPSATGTSHSLSAVTQLLFDGRYIWAIRAESFSNMVSRIDPATGTTITFNDASSNYFSLFNNSAYDRKARMCFDGDGIVVYDTVNGAVVKFDATTVQPIAYYKWNGSTTPNRGIVSLGPGAGVVVSEKASTVASTMTLEWYLPEGQSHGAFAGIKWMDKPLDIIFGGTGTGTAPAGPNAVPRSTSTSAARWSNVDDNGLSHRVALNSRALMQTPSSGVSHQTAYATAASALAYDGKYIWVGTGASGTFSTVDPVSYVCNTHSVDANGATASAIVSSKFTGYSSTGTRFIYTGSSAGVFRVEVTSAEVSSVSAQIANRNGIIDFIYDGQYLWYVDQAIGSLWRLSDVNNNTAATVAATETQWTATNANFTTGRIADDGRYIWGTTNSSDLLWKADKTAASVTVVTYALPGGSGVNGVAYDGRYLWVLCNTTSRVYRVDPTSADPINTGTLLTGLTTNPTDIIFDGQSIWVGGANGINKIDPERVAIITTFSTATTRLLAVPNGGIFVTGSGGVTHITDNQPVSVGGLRTKGGRAVNLKTINAAYTVLPDDHYLLLDTGGYTVTLPSGTNLQGNKSVKMKGIAGIAAVTVSGGTGIDTAAATDTINAGDSREYVWDEATGLWYKFGN